jgi:hypothetical protein
VATFSTAWHLLGSRVNRIGSEYCAHSNLRAGLPALVRGQRALRGSNLALWDAAQVGRSHLRCLGRVRVPAVGCVVPDRWRPGHPTNGARGHGASQVLPSRRW